MEMNKNLGPLVWGVAVLFILACAPSHGRCPDRFDRDPSGRDIPEIESAQSSMLVQLLSPSEPVRFNTMYALQKSPRRFSVDEIEAALTCGGDKNVSTLIFMFMEEKNDTFYHLGPLSRRVLESSQGSFPNIAYYYARVNALKGLDELIRLFDTRPDSRMAVCKAIGETGSSKGKSFLLNRVFQETTSGSRLPLLAGLVLFRSQVGKADILSLLKKDLDREEIISLSKIRTNFRTAELMRLYNGYPREHAYALEYIFMAPERHFDALKTIIDNLLQQKKYDRVRELLLSDRIRHSSDQRILQLRETAMKQINN